MKRMKKQQNNFFTKNKIEISRRTLLYSSAASLIPASLNAESIRDGSPSWMTTPGKTFSEYGFPAQQEINTKREILQPYEEYAPGTGVSMTPLEKLEGIKTHSEPENYKHVYQLFSIQLPSKKIRDGLMRFLAGRGIKTKVLFDPIHVTRHFSKYTSKQQNLPITRMISERILSLPMYPGIPKRELDYVVNFFKKISN